MKQDASTQKTPSTESGKSGKPGKPGKPENPEGPKVGIIERSLAPQRKGPVKGILGFEDELDQEALMAQAFADAGAEQEFAETKAEVIEREQEEYKAKHHIQNDWEMEGWGSWAGIVETEVWVDG